MTTSSLNPKADPYPHPITPMLRHIVYHPHPPSPSAVYLPPPPPPPPYLQPPLILFNHPMQLYNINSSAHALQFHQPPPLPPLYLAPYSGSGQKMTDVSNYHWDAKSLSWTVKKVGSLEKRPPRFRSNNHVQEVAKGCSGSSSIVAAQQVLHFADGEKTSVMIRNIPNKFRRGDILRFLDFYCTEFQLEYDFFYLPMDFMRHNNFGYAFVNFSTSDGAVKIMNLLDGYKWSDSQSNLQMKSSKKVCQVNWARIQGKEELVKHFQGIKFLCNKSEYLPVVFSPPRNGSTCLPTPSTVGRLGGIWTQKRR